MSIFSAHRMKFEEQTKENNAKTPPLRSARALTQLWASESQAYSAVTLVNDAMKFAATLYAASPFSARTTRRCSQKLARLHKIHQAATTTTTATENAAPFSAVASSAVPHHTRISDKAAPFSVVASSDVPRHTRISDNAAPFSAVASSAVSYPTRISA